MHLTEAVVTRITYDMQKGVYVLRDDDDVDARIILNKITNGENPLRDN